MTKVTNKINIVVFFELDEGVYKNTINRYTLKTNRYKLLHFSNTFIRTTKTNYKIKYMRHKYTLIENINT